MVLIITIVHSLPLASAALWQQWLLISLAVGAMIAAVATCVRAGRSMTIPVQHLVEVAMAVKNGRAKHRASGKVAGEFRPLADALNQMIEARQRAEEKLKLAQESLELKVHARTVELWRANKALQEEMEQRAKAERELQQAQKMDALGKFAGSIAHDFNNLLTVILGGAECAMQHIRPESEAMQFVRSIWKAGESAAALTRPLLTFSRNEVREVAPLDLNQTVEETAMLVRRLIGVNIQVKLKLAPELPMIVANANQFQQVLVNLAVNARDAMEGSGTLTMATLHASVDPERQIRHEATSIDWVELRVSDSGCGMDTETKNRIFEPFFTTKPAGRGTGLGLATVFGIVKQAGGFLEVESEVGVGTTFRIFLPVPEEPVEIQAPEPIVTTTKDGRPSGGETILLVEDEDEIRELAVLMLEGKGYHVIPAPDAEKALILAEEHGSGIQALITDVVMPRISGVQLAEILAKKMPELRILFVSGHCRESIQPETLAENRAEYLQKPYRSDSLIAAVQQVLRS
ncbi:ATP-binding protein [Chthoniobacter flavus]|uniref:ATP-binding protein n=1 Tax=Chthoniobacter flavus TaxID=191863 RepID=UPI00138ADD00|nr:ATP-binding protein [Chthoniobacter flavus]